MPMGDKLKHQVLTTLGGIASAAAVVKFTAAALTPVLGPGAAMLAGVAAGVSVATMALVGDLKVAWTTPAPAPASAPAAAPPQDPPAPPPAA